MMAEAQVFWREGDSQEFGVELVRFEMSPRH